MSKTFAFRFDWSSNFLPIDISKYTAIPYLPKYCDCHVSLSRWVSACQTLIVTWVWTTIAYKLTINPRIHIYNKIPKISFSFYVRSYLELKIKLRTRKLRLLHHSTALNAILTSWRDRPYLNSLPTFILLHEVLLIIPKPNSFIVKVPWMLSQTIISFVKKTKNTKGQNKERQKALLKVWLHYSWYHQPCNYSWDLNSGYWDFRRA